MDCSLPGSSVHRESPGKNIRVGCHTLLQGIVLTQGSNSGLPHCRWILYHLSHQRSPRILEWVAYPIQSIAIFFPRLLFLFIYFDWWIITLQYCDFFLPYINMNWPQVYMCPPPSWTPLPPHPHPSGLSQSTSFGCPTSCIELALVIYFTYSNVHVSVLFSQIIPPWPSPTESKSLFFMSAPPLLPCM